jgi:cytochrome c oxidase subunit III
MRSLHPEIQYATLSQQGETAQLGMWVFIATETLFFGALIFTYFIYRNAYPKEFAEAGKDAVLWCGSVNIGLLLTSSLTMVLAIGAAADGRRPHLRNWLLATSGLGIAFICVKGFEWYLDFGHQDVPSINFIMKPAEAPAGELFWVFYFIATPLHALHLLIGFRLILTFCGGCAAAILRPPIMRLSKWWGSFGALSTRSGFSFIRASTSWAAHEIRCRARAGTALCRRLAGACGAHWSQHVCLSHRVRHCGDSGCGYLHSVHAPQGPAISEMALCRRRVFLVIVSIRA